MKYHIEKGILPVLPGDYVWAVSRDPARLVRAVRVEEVVLRADNEMTVKAERSCFGWEYGEELFLTAEEAEQEAAKHRKEPPYQFTEQAAAWMPYETWIPDREGWYAVRIRREDGSEERRKAWYDSGNPYPEERGFYESGRRSAARLEHVVAWTGGDYIGSEEWYSGKPLDFSYAGIEELDLSVRVWNALKKQGIHVIRDIFKKDRETLMKTGHLGRKGMEELAEKLAKAGFGAEW